jgi:hypothetical protein
MKKKQVIMTVIIALVIMLLIPVIVFFSRAPVLIIAEQAFTGIYGWQRIKKEDLRSCAALFRRVKTVEIANDASDDIIRFVIQDVNKNPYYVIFPYRYARSAAYYLEHNPDIGVIILEGRYPENINRSADILENSNLSESSRYFIYKTDIKDEFYKAGISAASLAGGGNIAVFIDSGQNFLFGAIAREAFINGVNEYTGNLLPGENAQGQTRFYTSVSDYPENIELSCVVMAGNGADYYEKHAKTSSIIFSWLDPAFAPFETFLIIDDSVWVQAARAVKMADAGEAQGLISSKFLVLDRGKYNREVMRKAGNLP